MSDRIILEMAEARVLTGNYVAASKSKGKALAATFLAKQIKKIEPLYGNGFDQRVRGYMREIFESEFLEGTNQ